MHIDINHSLNKHITVGNFTADEIMIVVGSFGFTRVAHSSMLETIMIVGFGLYMMIIFKEIKETKIKGFIKHYLYWIGFYQKFKTLPPSYIREFVK